MGWISIWPCSCWKIRCGRCWALGLAAWGGDSTWHLQSQLVIGHNQADCLLLCPMVVTKDKINFYCSKKIVSIAPLPTWLQLVFSAAILLLFVSTCINLVFQILATTDIPVRNCLRPCKNWNFKDNSSIQRVAVYLAALVLALAVSNLTPQYPARG